MPILRVNLSDPADVRIALKALNALVGPPAMERQASRPSGNPLNLSLVMSMLSRKAIWPFLCRVAALPASAREFSLPELATLLDMTTNKVGSLKAIMAKPEQRLNVQFFEVVPGSTDAAGNPRYRMPEAIRIAILSTE